MTCEVTRGEYKPPIAITPPIIASLSPSGISPHVTTTSLKNIFGSGLNWRGFASLPFAIEVCSHWGLTTGIKASHADWYAGKSAVNEMMCVNCSTGGKGAGSSCMTASPPCSVIKISN